MMTNHEKIDAVLNYLAADLWANSPDISDGDLVNRLQKEYSELNYDRFPNDLLRILNKLITDGYITYSLRGNEKSDLIKHYQITFEGRLFNEKGGYTNQLKTETNKETLRGIERIALVAGTIGGGIAGIWTLFSDVVIRSILVSIALSGLAALIMPSISSIVKKR